MPKTTKSKKTAKTSAVVGGLKTQPKWKLGFLAVVVLLLITALGYVGFSAYKVRSLNAKAAGYATIYHDAGAGYMVRVCKIPTAYGYVLRAVANKPATTARDVGFSVQVRTSPQSISGNQVGSSKASRSWWGNTVTAIDSYAGSNSNWYKAYYQGGNPSYRETQFFSMAYTPTC